MLSCTCVHACMSGNSCCKKLLQNDIFMSSAMSTLTQSVAVKCNCCADMRWVRCNLSVDCWAWEWDELDWRHEAWSWEHHHRAASVECRIVVGIQKFLLLLVVASFVVSQSVCLSRGVSFFVTNSTVILAECLFCIRSEYSLPWNCAEVHVT